MKAVEHGLDVGMGLLIIVLSVSTALYGLVSYSKTDLYNGLKDKNTVNIEGSVIPADNVISKDIRELSLSLVAAAQNRDNIRKLNLIIRHAINTDDTPYEANYSLIENYDETYDAIVAAMAKYSYESPYGYLLDQGHYQAFVTSDQSNITCYILVK